MQFKHQQILWFFSDNVFNMFNKPIIMELFEICSYVVFPRLPKARTIFSF